MYVIKEEFEQTPFYNARLERQWIHDMFPRVLFIVSF